MKNLYKIFDEAMKRSHEKYEQQTGMRVEAEPMLALSVMLALTGAIIVNAQVKVIAWIGPLGWLLMIAGLLSTIFWALAQAWRDKK